MSYPHSQLLFSSIGDQRRAFISSSIQNSRPNVFVRYSMPTRSYPALAVWCPLLSLWVQL